jgi:hypothetical protein
MSIRDILLNGPLGFGAGPLDMFVPSNLERDTTMRVAGPEGQMGDSVSEVKPVETFGSEAVIERVIRTPTLSQPASGTQGLVAIDTLGPTGEYRDTQPRGDHQHRRSGAGRAEHRSHALRSEVVTPLSKRLALPGPGGLTKENRSP